LRYIGLSAPPPWRKASTTSRSSGSGLETVIKPSAQEPSQAAVSGVRAAPMTLGGGSGRSYNRADSTVTIPRWLTVSPAQSCRMISTHSWSRTFRSAFVGHFSPVMPSLSSCPLPTAIQRRPANICASVAPAWASSAG